MVKVKYIANNVIDNEDFYLYLNNANRQYDNSLIKKEEQESPVNPIVDKYPKLANACAQYPTIQLKVNEPPVQVEQGPVKKLTQN